MTDHAHEFLPWYPPRRWAKMTTLAAADGQFFAGSAV